VIANVMKRVNGSEDVVKDVGVGDMWCKLCVFIGHMILIHDRKGHQSHHHQWIVQ
jgi:hypothetical protein